MAVEQVNPIIALRSQILNGQYWCGSDTAFSALLNMLMSTESSMPQMRMDDDEDMSRFGGRYHYLLNKYDDVAVLDVRGSLVTYENWYNRYYGIVSYEEIRNAAITASRDPSITKILLKFDSPGGTAKGVDECCEVLQKLNTEVLPVYTLASGEMNSAAYFLGSAGKKIFATQMSMVGSIGTIRPLISYFRQLQEMGVDVKVIRSPEFKALGHPLDPLSEKAELAAQQSVDYFTTIFEKFVAENRRTTVQVVQSQYGKGSIFIGQQAVDAGLVDEVANFESVLRQLKTGATNFG